MKIRKKTMALVAIPFVIAGIATPILLTTVYQKKEPTLKALTEQEQELLNVKSSFVNLQGKINVGAQIDPLHQLYDFAIDDFKQAFGFQSFPPLPEGYDVKYTHNGIGVDGILIVYVHLIPQSQTNGTEVILQLPVVVAGIDMALATRVVQNLKQSNFNQLKATLPSQVTPFQVAAVIKQLITTDPARDLITPDHITLHNQDDVQGKITITIDNYGPRVSIAVDHFLTSQDVNNRFMTAAIANFAKQKPVMTSDVALAPLTTEQILTLEQAKVFGLNIDNIDQSLHLEYMHNGINADGQLTLTVIITDATKTLQKFVNVPIAVSGINAGDARRGVQTLTANNFDALKQQLPSSIKSEDVASMVRDLITNHDAAALILPQDMILKDVKDQYGTLTITVTNHGPDVTFNLTGFLNHATFANKKISDAIAILKAQTPKITVDESIAPLNQELPLDAKVAQSFGLDISALDESLSLKYTHNGIDADGKLTLIVIINDATSGVNRATNLDIDVSGINQALATSVVQGLNNSHFDSLKVNLPSEATALKIKQVIMILIAKEAARNLITDDNITLKDVDDQSGTMTVTISGHGPDVTLALDHFKTTQNVIDQTVEDAAAILTNQDISVNFDAAIKPPNQELLLDQAAANLYGISLVGIDPSLTLKYSHDGIFRDGGWTISVVITSADQSTVRITNVGINVTGINQGDATRTVQSLQPSNFDFLKDNLPSAIDQQDVLAIIQWLILNPPAQQLVKLDQITLQDANDQDGSLTIIVSGHGATKKLEVNGFITTSLWESNQIENALANLEAQTPTVNLDDILAPLHQELPFDQTAINLFGIRLTGLDPNLTFDYTHNGISANGILPISIVITSPSGITQVAQVNVNVIGIDEALARRAVQALEDNNFDALKEKLPSTVTRQDVLTIIQNLIASQSARDLVKLDNITLNRHDDDAGTLSLTVTGHGQDVNVTIRRFITTFDVEKEQLDRAIVLLAAQSPDIVRASAIEPQQDLQLLSAAIASQYRISLAGIDPGLTLNYSHNGLVANGNLIFNVVVRTQSGYEKTLRINIGVTGIDENDAKVAVQSLADADFDQLKNDVPTAVKIADVITIIRTLITNSQAHFLVSGDQVSLQNVDNTTGTMTIVVNGHGPQKTIAVTGFLTSAMKAIREKHDAAINSVDEVAINDYLKWHHLVNNRTIASEYQIQPPFTRTIDGIVVTFNIVASHFDDPAGKLYWKATLSSLSGTNRVIDGVLEGFMTRHTFYFSGGNSGEQRVHNLMFRFHDSREKTVISYNFNIKNDDGYRDALPIYDLRNLTIKAPNPNNARYLAIEYNTVNPLNKLHMNLTLNFFDGKKLLKIKFKIGSTWRAIIDNTTSFIPVNYF